MVPFKGTLRVPCFRKRLCIKSQAAGGSIDSFFPALFAKLCQGKDLAAPAMKGTLEGTECHYIILIIIIISVMLMVDFSNMFSKLS